MPTTPHRGIGKRVAYYRSVARLTQQQLADAASIHVGTLRKIERGARGAGDNILEALAAALGIDPSLLVADRAQASSRIAAAIPALSAAIAAYDLPDDGPVRPLPELRAAVAEATTWRLASQYVRITRRLPELLGELLRAGPDHDPDVAALLASACRAADAVAFKFGAYDLSARYIELMRWAAAKTGDPILTSTVAYVRTETFFASNAHAKGLLALELAIDAAASPDTPPAIAACGALHMRAAVIAGRTADADAADLHLAEARRLSDQVPEAIYSGTAFGPSSVRIHEVSVAVSLGRDYVRRALDIVRGWTPPPELPAERRSGFYIELARAQLWSGLPDDAFESLKIARRTAPQHARDHRWVREDAATLRRLKRANSEDLNSFAEWCHAT
ncbi:helix-turn-helix domain-containing protein [Nonomuraea sp. CA-218870]|uniref:Helix-turn-helix transcriptional regulator n=1 Tax=Nonomuraea corallina TaxID=2989783 RepID=A0ABT4SAY6_9ACTN|nr:helix-turn-helix transcriptional regulator [Nonomuraea corallina]MDA0634363.1 helix-turn-helix transcriptional regulator [Nonomuraea corallina]